MLGVWDKILIGLQHVCAIANSWQVLDLLPKDLSGFDPSPSTDKAKDLIEIFLAMKVQISSISMKEQSSVCVGLTGIDWVACTNQRETVL